MRFIVCVLLVSSCLSPCIGQEEALSNRTRIFQELHQPATKLAVNDSFVESLLWKRRVRIVGEETILSERLSFEPGLLALSPSGQLLIVADVFGGELALLSFPKLKLVDQLSLHAHNIAGVKFVNQSTFLITHQVLHADAPTTADNIAAGSVIENVLHEIRIVEDTETGISQLVSGSQKELGVPSNGAADPAGLDIDRDGNLWIALAGVDEVLALSPTWDQRARVSVGDRPLRVKAIGDSVYVYNQVDGSVTIVDRLAYQIQSTQQLTPPAKLLPSDRGERLFFSGDVSRFGWYSCHSCHPNGHTNYQLADTFADGTAGAPKRVLSLLGGRDNNPWAWNGQMRSLHDQVLQSGKTTMRGAGFSGREVNDLVAYLHTLESPPPFHPPENEQDKQLIEQGRKVFVERDCVQCHIPPLTYTSDGVFDVGIEDENGQKKFNPPTLIGVGYRRQFFHDARAKTLNDVFEEFGHQVDTELSKQDRQALIRFLQSL